MRRAYNMDIRVGKLKKKHRKPGLYPAYVWAEGEKKEGFIVVEKRGAPNNIRRARILYATGQVSGIQSICADFYNPAHHNGHDLVGNIQDIEEVYADFRDDFQI